MTHSEVTDTANIIPVTTTGDTKNDLLIHMANLTCCSSVMDR